MATKSLTFDIFGRDVSATKALKHVENGVKQTAKSFAGIGTTIAGGLAAAGITEFFKSSMDALKNWEQINAQTAARMQTTGNAAHVSVKGIEEMALAIEKNSGVSAEAIGKGENLLLTYTNIHNEVGKGKNIFDRTTQAAVDMSIATGRSASQSFKLLGRAINDPLTALSQMHRVGISFSADEKKHVKELMAHNKVAEAQAFILDKVNKAFGGAGQANAKTYAGKMAIIKDQFAHMGEKILKDLMPTLGKLSDWLIKTGIPDLENFVKYVKENRKWIIPLAGALGTLVGVGLGFNKMIKIATGLQWAFNAAMDANPVGAVIAGLTILVAEVITLTNKFGDTRKELGKGQVTWNTLLSVLTPVGAATTIVNEIVQHGQEDWKLLNKIIGRFVADVVKHVAGFLGTIRRWAGTTKQHIDHVIGWFQQIPRRVQQFFNHTLGWLFKPGQNIIQGLWNGITNIWNKLTKFISGIGPWIMKHKGPLSLDAKLLVPAGKAIMNGFLHGLTGGFSSVQKFMGSLFGGGGFSGGTSRRGAGGASRWSGMVSQALAMLGQPQSLLPGVLRRINLESGGNPNAINNWDSNAKAGHPSQGLMQTIPSTFYAYAGGFSRKGIRDPFANIYAGLRYALSRYGSIGAIDPLVHPGGYANGGDVGSTGSYMVGERGPERVILPAGSHVIPNHKLGGQGVSVIINGTDISKFIDVKIQSNDARAARRARMG